MFPGYAPVEEWATYLLPSPACGRKFCVAATSRGDMISAAIGAKEFSPAFQGRAAK
jgi:hypothetical protein